MHWCLDFFSGIISDESTYSMHTEQGCRAWMHASHSHVQSRVLLRLSVTDMQNNCGWQFGGEAQKVGGERNI